MNRESLLPHLGRLLANSDDAFEWDVAVPFDPNRYGARTIISMVKLVNRRGRVRWFERQTDGTEWRHPRPRVVVKADGDDRTFVADILDRVSGSVLIISFEDRTEARAFVRDLGRLSVLPKARQQFLEDRRQLRKETLREEKFVACAPPELYPSGDWFKGVRSAETAFGPYWATMLNTHRHTAAEVDSWMCANVKGRYFAGTWQAIKYAWQKVPNPPKMVKLSWRYWRLTFLQWHRLLEKADQRNLLVVNFIDHRDFLAFDGQYGAGTFANRTARSARARCRGSLQATGSSMG